MSAWTTASGSMTLNPWSWMTSPPGPWTQSGSPSMISATYSGIACPVLLLLACEGCSFRGEGWAKYLPGQNQLDMKGFCFLSAGSVGWQVAGNGRGGRGVFFYGSLLSLPSSLVPFSSVSSGPLFPPPPPSPLLPPQFPLILPLTPSSPYHLPSASPFTSLSQHCC